MVCPVKYESVFGEVDQTRLEDINVSKRVIPFKKKQTIFQANSVPNGLHIVHMGKVKLTKVNSLGIEQIIGFATKGDIFGYDSMLANQDYHITATAIDDCIICFIPKEKIIEMIRADGNFALKLFEHGFNEFTEIANNYSNMVQKPLRQKVALSLLFIMDSFGLNQEDVLDARLSREEIANIALSTTASTIRTLSEFNSEGLIELIGKQIKILDLPRLRQEADKY